MQFREATETDLPGIVQLLADDPLGQQREAYALPLPSGYTEAFQSIDTDPNNRLIVAMDNAMLAGVLQLTFIPNLTYQGSWRAQIEGVRVAVDYRSRGVGRALLEWSIEVARQRSCHLVQLTTDRQRPDALRFYESLGFKPSHTGLKLHLL